MTRELWNELGLTVLVLLVLLALRFADASGHEATRIYIPLVECATCLDGSAIGPVPPTPTPTSAPPTGETRWKKQ